MPKEMGTLRKARLDHKVPGTLAKRQKGRGEKETTVRMRSLAKIVTRKSMFHP